MQLDLYAEFRVWKNNNQMQKKKKKKGTYLR